MRIRITHQRITALLQLILMAEAAFALWGQRWFTAFLTGMIILITFMPVVFERRFRIHIPPELQLAAIGFVFASLFLGEIRDYYTRFWWWDMALHTTSGFLLGIFGFLLVHIMNETEKIQLHMKPGFVAFFAFLFALGVGALWEIFEFTMDSVFGMTCKPCWATRPASPIPCGIDRRRYRRLRGFLPGLALPQTSGQAVVPETLD